MDIVDFYNPVSELVSSPWFGLFVRVSFLIFFLVWIALIVFISRDIFRRTHNVYWQVISLVCSAFHIPGLFIYFLIRPFRTLDEIYDESLERDAYMDAISLSLHCHGCDSQVSASYVYCPGCNVKLKNKCGSCGKHVMQSWKSCANCGYIDKKNKNQMELLPKTEAEEKKSA